MRQQARACFYRGIPRAPGVRIAELLCEPYVVQMHHVSGAGVCILPVRPACAHTRVCNPLARRKLFEVAFEKRFQVATRTHGEPKASVLARLRKQISNGTRVAAASWLLRNARASCLHCKHRALADRVLRREGWWSITRLRISFRLTV